MTDFATRLGARVLEGFFVGLAKVMTAVRAQWIGTEPVLKQRLYVANHASHADFVLIWAALPAHLRKVTRPVAAADYWGASRLRTYISRAVFRAALVDRTGCSKQARPTDALCTCLAEGDSLIIFPEGTRNTTGSTLLPFKSGIFHLAQRYPGVEIVPVWIDNVSRVLPKGALLPVPLQCNVSFGAPLTLRPDEAKPQFLDRVRAALLHLAPLEAAAC